MDNENYFKDLFESIHDYRKIVLIILLIQNDKDLLLEVGFSEHGISGLNKEFKNIIMEQHEEYLDNIKDQEEGVLERFLNK